MTSTRYLRLTEAAAGTATETGAEPNGRTREAFSDPNSLSTRVEAVHRAFNAAFPSNYDAGISNYVEEIYEDRVLAMMGEDTYRISYEPSGTSFEFGEPEKVTVTLNVTAAGEEEEEEEVEEADRHRTTGSTAILESRDEGEGWVWRVTMVRPGVSKNGRRYRPEVLAEAIQLYEGAKSFDGHRDDATRRSSSVSGMAGWHQDVAQAADGSLTSDFHISEAREDVRQLFLTAWRNNRPDLIGFSHDIGAATEPAIIDGRRIKDVTKIVEVHSVDVVADPSAGGRIERLVASRQREDQMDLTQFLQALRRGELTPEQIAEAYEEHPEWEQIAEAVEAAASETPPPAPPAAPPAQPTPLSGAVRAMVIDAEATRRNLPAAARERLEEALADVHDEETIVARIQETADIWAAAAAARPAPLAGQTPVQVGTEEREKMGHALDAMIAGETEREGIPAFRSIKEAYSAFTGRQPYGLGDEDFNRWLLAESVGAIPYAGAQRLTESIETSTWAEAFGDSIRRRMIAEYQSNDYNSWRQIVSEIGNLQDFRTNRRVRLGGYDVLPTVGQGATYNPLTSPADEEATYAQTKKGGTEDYTLEAIANDDLSALRRIPRALGRAAALTLYRAIWNTTIAANATIYDGVALFHDGSHSNDNATTPLAEAGIQTLRTKMVRQKQQGETSGYVGLLPRFLAVPPELYVTAYKLTQSSAAVVGTAESATTPNPFRGLISIEVPTLTDTNDWFLIADPASVPTIEVGFYQGRQDPELFIQDQPTVGSVFTADKFTWKIRHIWGLVVLDYRGFQRATNV
jgi:hypothetical protein